MTFEWSKRDTLVTACCCCSVAQLFPPLCDPMNCSIPGFPVLHHLQDACSNSCPLSPWCHSIILFSVVPFSSCSQSFPASVFSNESALCITWPKYQSFSFNIHPSVNTQDWSPLGWTGCISLQSKGLSRVFSNTTVQKHQFFGTLYSPTLISIHDYWKNHSFD